MGDRLLMLVYLRSWPSLNSEAGPKIAEETANRPCRDLFRLSEQDIVSAIRSLTGEGSLLCLGCSSIC